MIMSEQLKPSIQTITQLHEEHGGFQYGKDQAAFANGTEFKNTKKMHRKVEEIVQGLQLPFIVPDELPTIRHESGPAFIKVESSSHDFFLHARSIINEKPLVEVIQGKPVAMHVVSGSCLFSADSVHAIADDGERFSLTSPAAAINKNIQNITVDPDLSLYEAEASVRLSLFISELAKGGSVDSIQLNIPRIEYYNYALDAFENGHLSPNQMLEWFAAVDTRFQRLSSGMKKRIRRPLEKEAQPLFISTQPLGILEDYIKGEIVEAEAPDLEKAKRILVLSSPLWETVLALQNPQNWVGLNNASYIVAELQAARVPKHDDTTAHIAVAVENYTENKIMAGAKKVYEALPDKNEDYHLIGLYPHEHVVPVGENTGKTMYYVKKPEVSGTHHARTIFSAYRPTRK